MYSVNTGHMREYLEAQAKTALEDGENKLFGGIAATSVPGPRGKFADAGKALGGGHAARKMPSIPRPRSLEAPARKKIAFAPLRPDTPN